jgi:hypothetical protein
MGETLHGQGQSKDMSGFDGHGDRASGYFPSPLFFLPEAEGPLASVLGS